MVKLFLTIIVFLQFISCSTNPISGRKQLSLFPESDLQQQALTSYKSFLSSNTVIDPKLNANAALVQRVGANIQKAITAYYSQKGISNELAGYHWEFNLVKDDNINAWCMPGGKVVVYSGLLEVTKNESALAIVLGHEITHAVAHHGNERMSQAAMAQGLQIAGNIFTDNNSKANRLFNDIFAPGSQVAYLLPNSRRQEYEADHFGLIFSAIAGYNPREAIPFWQRMSAIGGSKPPEFLSTHPSDEHRIKQLQDLMPEALSYYKP